MLLPSLLTISWTKVSKLRSFSNENHDINYMCAVYIRYEQSCVARYRHVNVTPHT